MRRQKISLCPEAIFYKIETKIHKYIMFRNDKPITHQLRLSSVVVVKSDISSSSSLMSIDEQIAALQNAHDSSDSDYSDSDEELVGNLNCNNTLEETDDLGNIVKLISAIDREEKIVPLGKEFLPGIQCSNSKKFSKQKLSDKTKESSKRIRFNEDKSETKSASGHSGILSGLESTVRELLRNYEPASIEKRPFYCRVCKFQGQTTDELDAHRLSEFHLVASDMERKMSFCKLCRKQFTSPDQLKEHLSGKGHFERLERMKLNNTNRKKFC